METTTNDILIFNIYGATAKGTFVSQDADAITIKVTEDFTGAVGKERTIRKEFLITNNIKLK